MKRYFYLYLCSVFASLGGLLSGFDMGVISGAVLYIQKSFSLSADQIGLLVGCASFGAVLGAVINGILIDKIGRKKVLIVSALIFFLGSILCFYSQNIIQLILSRTFLGCAVGIVSFACPLYLSEISTKEKRGAIVSLFQLAITFGILFSYFINFVFSTNSLNWRIMLSFGIVPAFIMIMGMMFCSDTPRWYVLNNQEINAKRTMQKIYNDCDYDEEINNIKSTLYNFKNEKLKFSKKLIMPFIIGVGMMFCQIVSGINAIIYYAPSIFKNAGFGSNSDVLLITIFIGLINFLMTFVAITFVDKTGRKPLLYIGIFGMMISCIILSLTFILDFEFIKYFSIIACCLYIVSFSMSLGPIALLIISEIFPLKYRGTAMSFAIVANFIFNFITTTLFPIALEKFGGSITFLFFGFICLISILFVRYIVPETKGISLEKIENQIN